MVDDHDVVRLGLRALFENTSGFVVAGEASTAAEAVELAQQLRPDVVLMDVRLPDQSGVAACEQICEQWPAARVLMLSSFADDALVLAAIEAGASGYLLKQEGSSELVQAVRAVARGKAILDSAVTRQVLERVRQARREEQAAAFHSLSEREMHVLALVADGKTNIEIAAQLNLSEKTIRNHVSSILSKLNLSNRIEAATYAVRHHIERHLPR